MSDEDRIDPAARFIARNARYWDPVAAFHLLEALSHNLATLFPPRERYAKLGLVIRLISVGTGEVPPVAEYDAARTEAEELGESGPSRSDLNYSYGSWSKAVKAAMETFYGNSRVPTSTRHARLDEVAYSNDEVVEQLLVCRESIGFAPNQWEYEEWARVARLLKRRAGLAPRIPGLVQIRKAFGSFDNAALAARNIHQQRGGAHDDA
ncbi:MAG: hypothetical protein ACPGYP_04890 [Solirubrobacterales bacterium]